MTNKGDAKVSAYKQASLRHRQEFHDHLDLTLRLQADLKSDADQLKAQEGWDVATCKGIDVWTDDLATVFRFLKRNDWKAEKTYPILLDALSMRATKSLHLPIPKILPYSQSDLFYMLPLPQHTDKLGRPICVLTCRHILRNERGLDDLIQWVWWSCELLRRTLSDYWTARRWGGIQGVGSEGCVVIVDAGGAGYRNLEVELLPNLVKVSSKNFPGLIQNVFVFNAGWTQRSLWKIVKPILPSTAIQRIKFIEASSGYEEYFEKNALPKVFGGTNGYTFHPDNNPLLNYYSSHSLNGPESGGTETKLPTRNASFASTAEIFHTASNTPITSRRGSVSVSQNDHHALRMTKSFHVLPTTGINSRANAPHIVDHTPSVTSPVSSASQEVEVISTVQDLTIHAQLDTSTASTEKGMSPLQRIRSMADFKLYLSPSRLAQVDLLNSDSEDDHPMDTRARRRSSVRTIQPILQRRRTLRPVAFEPGRFLVPNGVTERRSRPPLRLLGIPNHLTQVEENRRSYSDLLIRHHAEELQKLDQIPAEVLRQHAVDDHVDLSQPDLTKPNTSPPITPYPISAGNHIGNIVPISAFSRSANPFYGYPAIRLPSPGHPDHASIQPRYARRRKRDLVKTLLFLFLLRLQSLRDGIERTLGLNRLLPWTGGASSHQRYRKALDPSEGLMRTYEGENGKKVKRTIGSDWFWAVMTLALVRGGWIGFLAWPLELLGLQGLKGMLRV